MTAESRLSPAEQLHSQTCLSFLEEDDLCIHKRMCLRSERLNCNYLNRNVLLFCRSFCACYLLHTTNILPNSYVLMSGSQTPISLRPETKHTSIPDEGQSDYECSIKTCHWFSPQNRQSNYEQN